MAEENPKKKSTLDNIVMGAIIERPLGPPLGWPWLKKGSETREIIKEKTKDAGGFGQLAKKLLKRLLGKKETLVEEMKEIPNEMEILPPKAPHE